MKGGPVLAVCERGGVCRDRAAPVCAVGAEHHWKALPFPARFLQRPHARFMSWSSFDCSPGYRVAALFSVGSIPHSGVSLPHCAHTYAIL